MTESHTSMPRVLMIAFHLPPARGASGAQRTLGFARHLPACGWQPHLLSVHPRAYTEREAEIPTLETPITRAPAWDASRHLAIAGKYPRFAALPDRYSSWWPGAVAHGLALIRRLRPQVIWSTYPIATAHLIALTLHRITGLPWVADFRDPMIFPFHPATPEERNAFAWIEARAVARSSRIVLAAPGMADYFHDRHPGIDEHKLSIIPNGWDELPAFPPPPGGQPLTLLHSGQLYPGPGQRDPTAFFQALARLRQEGIIAPETLRVVLRAAGNEAIFRPLLTQLGLDDLVTLPPLCPREEALREMAAADALLVFQGAAFNRQVPAKLFEYLALHRPILALTPPTGDTAALLRDCGVTTTLPMDDAPLLAAGLAAWLPDLSGLAPDPLAVARHARSERTRQLAALFDHCATGCT